MEYWQPLLLMATGIVAGFMNVMAGGGSMLTLPVMVFIGLPGPVANGTNRIAIVAQSLVAVVTFFRKGFADFRLSLTLALAAIPGAVAGALVGVQLRGVWFNRVLAIVMVGVMILSWRKSPAVPDAGTPPAPPSPRRMIAAHLLMVLVGFYGGFIQIGVGFLFMAVMMHVLRLDLVRVNMHKVFIVGVFNIAALVVYASSVPVVWTLGLALALGNAAGGWLGAHTSVSHGEQLIRWVLNTVLIVFIIKLLLG
ncbi:MAG: sulfite exporter TauE/SafE family protein [Gammaproteobacteria bacterium]|nr:sulfite exporter TauE/SafE family protein [Gammaproteobacteria bacterium]